MILSVWRRFGWIGLAALFAFPVPAAERTTTYYVKTPLVSDSPGVSGTHDQNLKSPWGLAAAPNGPWYVSDEDNGLSTVYTDAGKIEPILVSIPSSQFDFTNHGTPTGVVYNGYAANFLGASFIYCTHDGTISAILENSPSATVEVDNGALGSSYTGIAIAGSATKAILFAANFASGKIEAYNTSFESIDLPPEAFTDPSLPSDFHPFNVAVIGGHVMVAYAVYSSTGVVTGAGNGFIDAYGLTGALELRFAQGAYLNAPWGMAVSPASFGQFGSNLLVAQQGAGTIVAFNAGTGAEEGTLQIEPNTALSIPEIWGLAFGTGGEGGLDTTLFFTSALSGGVNGEFGTITVNPQ